MPSWDDAAARGLVASHQASEGGLLPALQALLRAYGYVDRRAIPLLAEVFNLSKAEVAGVVSFYKDVRTEPPGRHVVQLCGGEACQAVGGDAVARGLEAATLPDVAVETVYCLGNCALGPAALIDGKLYGRVDARSVARQLRR